MNLPLPRTNRSTLQALWQLGGPVALQSLLAALLGLVDTVMVSGLGPAALGGVGLVNRLLFVVTMLLAGLASGVGVLVAQLTGAGRQRAIRGPVLAAIGLGLGLTLPLALLALSYPQQIARLLSPDEPVQQAASLFLVWSAAYAPLTAIVLILGATLRSQGDTLSPLLAGLIALALNTALNYVFITGRFGLPGFGIPAAAVATLIARLIELAALLWILKPGRAIASLPRHKDTRLMLGATLPLMAKEIFWASGAFASYAMVARLGTEPLAALNLVTPVEGIMLSAFSGCGMASAILLGQALGRRAFDDAFDAGRRLLRLISLGGFVLGLLLAAITQLIRHSDWLLGAIDPALHDLALDSLTVLFAGMGFRVHNMTVSLGVLRSGNDTRWLMWTDLLFMWGIGVPLVALAALVWHWPLPTVVGAMMLEEALKVMVFRRRVKSGRWVHAIAT